MGASSENEKPAGEAGLGFELLLLSGSSGSQSGAQDRAPALMKVGRHHQC